MESWNQSRQREGDVGSGIEELSVLEISGIGDVYRHGAVGDFQSGADDEVLVEHARGRLGHRGNVDAEGRSEGLLRGIARRPEAGDVAVAGRRTEQSGEQKCVSLHDAGKL